MIKGRINNNYYLRYGLVALITLAFVVATYFIVNPETSCEAQGKVNDPTPGHHGQCLEQCKLDTYRCVSSNCKHRWSAKTGLVCSDCEIGKIPLKDEGTKTYNCVPECNNDKPCSDGEKCKHLSNKDDGSPSYCAKNLYRCVQDDGGRGHYCTPVTSGSGGMPLNECLKRGMGNNYPCTCNHKQGYALNSANTACSTTACTLDGLNGWGSNQPTSTNNSNKSSYVDPIVDEKKGTCYAMDEKGLLLDPKVDKTCSIKTTAEECHDTNSDGWKCKWLPGVKCTRKKYNKDICTCVNGCSDYSWSGTKQPDCAGFQYQCFGRGGYLGQPKVCFQKDVRDVYSIPPTNCLARARARGITEKKSLQKMCPNSFNKDNNTAKTNEQIGGYNPA